MNVRVVVLGNVNAGDDGAALRAMQTLERTDADIVRAGRPGPLLLDLLDTAAPVVLVDVVRSGQAAGSIHRMSLADIVDSSVAVSGVSSHGFGPAEVLKLGAALDRQCPQGRFVGIEGDSFQAGDDLSPAVQAALPALVEAVQHAIDEAAYSRSNSCTKPDLSAP